MWYNNNVIKRADKLLKTEKRKENMAMTEREFLTKVLAIEGLSKELSDHATESINKLNARNDKRKTTQTKTQKENEPIATAILETLGEHGGTMLGVDLASAIGQTTNKTNGVAGVLVNSGQLTKTKVKVKGKGEMTQYTLAVVEDTAEDTDAVDTEDTATD